MKKRALLLAIGGIMMLGGIVATGISALMLYLFWSLDFASGIFFIIALTFSLLQLISGLVTMLKSDKNFSCKPFVAIDIAIIILSVVLIVVLGKLLPTQLLTGIIVPLLHIIIVKHAK